MLAPSDRYEEGVLFRERGDLFWRRSSRLGVDGSAWVDSGGGDGLGFVVGAFDVDVLRLRSAAGGDREGVRVRCDWKGEIQGVRQKVK